MLGDILFAVVAAKSHAYRFLLFLHTLFLIIKGYRYHCILFHISFLSVYIHVFPQMRPSDLQEGTVSSIFVHVNCMKALRAQNSSM